MRPRRARPPPTPLWRSSLEGPPGRCRFQDFQPGPGHVDLGIGGGPGRVGAGPKGLPGGEGFYPEQNLGPLCAALSGIHRTHPETVR
jgi:hypothetical protein